MSLNADLVAHCERPVADPGPHPSQVCLDDHGYRAAAERVAASRPPGPLWIFAYGSLIWRPECNAIEQRKALAKGWHRAFSIELTRWRGTADTPGLMLALERGGSCVGVAFRLADEDPVAVIETLLRREVDEEVQLGAVRWIKVDAGGEAVMALTFWAGAKGLDYVAKRPLPQTARMLASACGHWGSGAAYLYNTVVHLEELGIRDSTLWRLQKLVAEEISARIVPGSDA